MSRLATLTIVALSLVTLAACDNGNDRLLQGWVEADLVFVSPDEQLQPHHDMKDGRGRKEPERDRARQQSALCAR